MVGELTRPVKSVAVLLKTMVDPSPLIIGRVELPSPELPSSPTLTRMVVELVRSRAKISGPES